MGRQIEDFVTRERLALQVAEKMREAIRSGEWVGELPGIRGLMARFGVSRPPVLEAMVALEREGWIGPARAGRQREVHTLEDLTSEGVVLFCREIGNAMPSLTARVFQDLDGWFLRHGIAMQQVIRDPRKPKLFEQSLKEVFRRTSAVSGVVALDVPHAEIRRVIGPLCPLMLMSSSSIPDDNCAIIAAKLVILVDRALRHLFERGIKRLCLVLGGVPATTVTHLQEVASRAFADAGVPFQANFHVVVMEPGRVPLTVREIMRKEHPQVLLTVGDDYWARLQWEVHQLRTDTKVMTLWNSPQFRQFEQPPAVFELAISDYTKALLQWTRALQSGANYRFVKQVGAKLL